MASVVLGQHQAAEHTFTPGELPVAEPLELSFGLDGHPKGVNSIASLPDGKSVATACWDGHVRTFALGADGAVHGRGELLHDLDAHNGAVYCVCALGGDIIASSGVRDGKLSTWRASTGELVQTVEASASGVLAVAALGLGRFVVGAKNEDVGDLVFFCHNEGRQITENARVPSAHLQWVNDMAVCHGALITASNDKTAVVWDTASYSKRAVLRGSTGDVCCVAANDRLIATGSGDKMIRIYRNGDDFAVTAILFGLHKDAIWSLKFLGKELLMSASLDGTAAFSELPEAGQISVPARLQVGFRVYSTMVLCDGYLGLAGSPSSSRGPRATICVAPSVVFAAAKSHV